VWGRGWVSSCAGMRGLFKFILEVSEYGIEDSVNGKGVIIIKVVVYVCLCMWKHSIVNCNNRMMSCMFPRVCECSIRCSAYFEVWLLCIKERLCSLNLVLTSRPVCPTYAFPQSGQVSS